LTEPEDYLQKYSHMTPNRNPVLGYTLSPVNNSLISELV
jgi:hypothetical protein